MSQPPVPDSTASAESARIEIDQLYTPLDEALALLRERRTDETLRTKIEEFHRNCPPTFLPNEPCACFSRQIVTPNREFEVFASTVAATGLSPLCVEHAADIMFSSNRLKYHWRRPMFEVRPNHFRGLRMMDLGSSDGKRLCDLRLQNGMPLHEFHHALLQFAFPELELILLNYSDWFTAACRPDFFYLHFLALFIRDGILFENFLPADSEELRFARERVIPSFTRAIELFGVKPLIVPLLPRDKESFADCERWDSYAGELLPEALRLSGIRSRKYSTPGQVI